ncbi:23S rRNA (guanosine(2251)-2'-O)-methyltransferase RlmB [Wolbachia endosymbiont of Howardula sp.]|uniref:23S rRNA (guanosine(2251)-2'-O)-methyltransferase RlmB n=1 Tax=Wolbachia endosymbiont of Howardula sp. TaxID=2916816 RepID=UPI00217E406D|nr:23S rRNA (guanosine(2251)-2'-O)-methyltransferase RlmB [Wolbachia endosymbiont of Howardula sp.]UWI83126.1 23S rRNA (guanosine(2251)-2'-O)-methyltransferase RlmB [Wolbachia endosymbiont of Howardula sp.]
MTAQQIHRKIWLYGKHTCISALQNKKRRCIKILMTDATYHGYYQKIKQFIENKCITLELVQNIFLNKLFHGTYHQGIALKVDSLIMNNLNLAEIANRSHSTIVILDQVTDMRNIGSILRTAACFNVDVLILPRHYSPNEFSLLAKAASGALENVPLLYVTNIVQTIDSLKEMHYWCYGFDCNVGENLEHIVCFADKRVIIFGSEDRGIRTLVKSHCDYLLKIPTTKVVNSLNVSNAAAIVLYSLYVKT